MDRRDCTRRSAAGLVGLALPGLGGTPTSRRRAHPGGAAAAAASATAVHQELRIDPDGMPSGAGHDARSMAAPAPVGMISPPSRDGISRAPHESTAPEEVARGTDVLLRTLLALDRIEPA